jgi:uncharacterized protein YerC
LILEFAIVKISFKFKQKKHANEKELAEILYTLIVFADYDCCFNFRRNIFSKKEVDSLTQN